MKVFYRIRFAASEYHPKPKQIYPVVTKLNEYRVLTLNLAIEIVNWFYKSLLSKKFEIKESCVIKYGAKVTVHVGAEYV